MIGGEMARSPDSYRDRRLAQKKSLKCNTTAKKTKKSANPDSYRDCGICEQKLWGSELL